MCTECCAIVHPYFLTGRYRQSSADIVSERLPKTVLGLIGASGRFRRLIQTEWGWGRIKVSKVWEKFKDRHYRSIYLSPSLSSFLSFSLFIYIYIYIYIYIPVPINLSIYLHPSLPHSPLFLSLCLCLSLSLYIYIYICVCVCVCVFYSNIHDCCSNTCFIISKSWWKFTKTKMF